MLAGSRPERLEPFSCVLKGAGRGRKNKPRHTLGGCRLARALGTSSPVPGYGAQPALPPGTHPRLGRFRSVLKLFLGAIRNNFFIEYGISQYFSREMGYLDQKGDFLSGSMCDAYVLMHLYPSKGCSITCQTIVCGMLLVKHKVQKTKKFGKCQIFKIKQNSPLWKTFNMLLIILYFMNFPKGDLCGKSQVWC